MECRSEGGQLYWQPGGTRVTRDQGRFNWYGRDTQWKDVLGFRGRKEVEKPAGEWNTTRVVAKGTHIEHWLNGQKVVEYEQGSPDWAAHVAAGKFGRQPQYGKAMKGYIGLQEHGGRAEFRNIKIRELK